MKMTLVLDTDDPQGLDDAYKIAAMLRKKHHPDHRLHAAEKAAFGKIGLIKFLRAYGRECALLIAQGEKDGEEPRLAGLRECKQFVDQRWDKLIREP